MPLSSKKWKYVYEDNVIVIEVMLNGKSVLCRTAEHHPGNKSAPIQYLVNGTCLIYSDVSVPGLKLIASDKIAHSLEG